MEVDIFRIPIEDFKEIFPSPMKEDVWGVGSITIKEVKDRIKKKRLASTPFSCGNEDREYHIRRIAFLVVHPHLDDINIEIGLYYNYIDDGNHRYSAALVRGDESIDVSFGGGVDEFHDLFPNAVMLKIA